METTQLRELVDGTVLAPGDDGYTEAVRYHSGVGTPDAYVRPLSVQALQAAVGYAATNAMTVMVRGGGHSAWGAVPGGMTIDLAEFQSIAIDRGDGRVVVRIGGGAVWGEVAQALSKEHLAISSGDTASVGVGGLTLGGGIGWMVRSWGLASDQLVGATVVTAQGELVHVSEGENEDLFWALRGGGGGYGAVVEFEFVPHELEGVVFAEAQVDDAAVALRSVRDAMVSAPHDLTATFMDVPPMDPSAPPGATMSLVWASPDEDSARAAFAPVFAAGTGAPEIAPSAYPDLLQDMPAADPEHPMPGFVGGNVLVDELTDDVIDALVAFRATWPASVVFTRSLGGAFSEVSDNATAFGSRSAQWFIMAGAFDVGLDDATRAAVVAAWAQIRASGSTTYSNFSDRTDPSAVVEMFAPENAERLKRVKSAWDPHNVFSRAHVYVPETEASS